MGKWMFISGLILTLVGGIGGAILFSTSLSGVIAQAIAGPVESEVCRTGERLVSEVTDLSGISRTPQPDETFNFDTEGKVAFFCVNNDNIRRDVSDAFAQDLFSQAARALPSLGFGLLFIVLPCIGTPLMLLGFLGFIVSRLRGL